MNLQNLTQYGIEEAAASLLLIQINNHIAQELSSQLAIREEELLKEHELNILSLKLYSFIENQLILASAKNITAVKALVIEKLDITNNDFYKDFAANQELVINIIQELKTNEDTQFLFDVKNQKSSHKYNNSDIQKNQSFKGFKPIESSSSVSKTVYPSYEELCATSINI